MVFADGFDPRIHYSMMLKRREQIRFQADLRSSRQAPRRWEQEGCRELMIDCVKTFCEWVGFFLYAELMEGMEGWVRCAFEPRG